jgi:hypothetical protein
MPGDGTDADAELEPSLRGRRQGRHGEPHTKDDRGHDE